MSCFTLQHLIWSRSWPSSFWTNRVLGYSAKRLSTHPDCKNEWKSFVPSLSNNPPVWHRRDLCETIPPLTSEHCLINLFSSPSSHIPMFSKEGEREKHNLSFQHPYGPPHKYSHTPFLSVIRSQIIIFFSRYITTVQNRPLFKDWTGNSLSKSGRRSGLCNGTWGKWSGTSWRPWAQTSRSEWEQ